MVVLSINADNNDPGRIREYVEKAGLKQPILLNGSGVAMETYSARAYPTTYWIDKKGNLVERQYGFHDFGKLERTARKYLGK